MRQDQQPPRRFYRVREIMAVTGVSKGKVYQALRDGRLQGLKLDGVLLIPAESFEAWIAEAVPWSRSVSSREPSGTRFS
jgi:excisionase family DNA binding protein